MSLAEFQRAMADLAASPDLCRRAQTDTCAAMQLYSLSERERGRIASVVRQPGMAVNCSIHRATRLLPLDTLLPLTCAALGKAFAVELEDYWSVASRPAIRFDVEAARFVAHLENQLAGNTTSWPWPAACLLDLARLELAIETLRIAPRAAENCNSLRFVDLDHNPSELLAGAQANPPDPSHIRQGKFLVLLALVDGQIGIFSVPPSRMEDVRAFQRDGIAAPWLIEAGVAAAIGLD